MKQRVKMSFAGLGVAASGFFAGVAITPDDGTGETEYVTVSYEDVYRVGRDHAEAQRKAAQAAGDDVMRQSWLIERRLADAAISMRELRKKIMQDKPPVIKPKPKDTATMPASSPIGTTSDIALKEMHGVSMLYVSARMTKGMSVHMQCVDAETRAIIDSKIIDADNDNDADYILLLWAKTTQGRSYEVTTWVDHQDGTNPGLKSMTFKAS